MALSEGVEPVFKGMTRPALYLGVPLPALFIIAFLIGVLFLITHSLLVVPLAIPLILTIRIIIQIDEYIFSLHYLKYKTRGRYKSMKLWGSNTFLSQKYRRPFKEGQVEFNNLPLNEQPALTQFIPYSSHIKKNIVITRNGEFIATWRCDGISFETEDDGHLNLRKEQFNTLIQSFATHSVAFYEHNVRHHTKESMTGHYSSKFLKEIDEKYYDSFKDTTLQRNTLYLTLVYIPYSQIEKISRKTSNVADKKQEIEYQLEKMLELCNRLDKSLEKFGGTALTTFEKGGAVYSNQLAFYNYLISGAWQPVRVTKTPFYNTLGSTILHFGRDTGEIKFNTRKSRFFRCIEIKDYVEVTYEGILDALMYVNIDYTITHSFKTIPKKSAAEKLKLQGNKLKSADDDSSTQIEDLEMARDDLASGRLSFGYYHFSLFVYGNTIKEVTNNTNELINILNELGFIVTLANIALPAAYFGQFPANFAYRPRVAMLSSKNFASLTSLHNFAIGKKNGNPWGDAVTLLKTPSGQPYYFNFHQTKPNSNDFGEKFLANTMVIGQSGSGKTMLLTFLVCQLQKFGHDFTFSPKSIKRKLTTIYLDKDYGAMGAIVAMGGKYLTIKKGVPTGFNPFICEKTAENISFLNSLVKILVTRNNKTLSSLDEEILFDAINAVMELDIEFRHHPISRLIEHLPTGISREEQENSLSRRLRVWAESGAYGWVFDNETDTLDFGDYAVFGIDGTEFLDDPDTCAPLSFYILNRIQKLLDGRRLGLFMDEIWKWLQDEAFSDFAYNKLKTIRKDDGFTVGATQSPDEILKSPISRAVIEQSETMIFFPNPAAQEKEYTEGFKISSKQFEIISSLDPDSRTFLVKKGHDTALAKLDLSSLGTKNLKLLSTSKDNGEILKNVISEYGDNPDVWIPEYEKRYV